MATGKWIEREIGRNAAPAAKRGARARAQEPHAQTARFDEKTGRIVVDLTNGAQFAFPPKIAQGLSGAKKAEAARANGAKGGRPRLAETT